MTLLNHSSREILSVPYDLVKSFSPIFTMRVHQGSRFLDQFLIWFLVVDLSDYLNFTNSISLNRSNQNRYHNAIWFMKFIDWDEVVTVGERCEAYRYSNKSRSLSQFGTKYNQGLVKKRSNVGWRLLDTTLTFTSGVGPRLGRSLTAELLVLFLCFKGHYFMLLVVALSDMAVVLLDIRRSHLQSCHVSLYQDKSDDG
ncbi:hypothetical protein Lal_00045455 [Lupinus albus]|nr:hypothetical protein Lal_00045455 [Lupinus albus]